MKITKSNLVFLIFCTIFGHLSAQKTRNHYVQTGLELIRGAHITHAGTVLGTSLEMGFLEQDFKFGLQYSTGISALQVDWQHDFGLGDILLRNRRFIAIPPPDPINITPETNNIFTKCDNFSVHVRRKKAKRAGYLDFKLGATHIRPHIATALDYSFSGISTNGTDYIYTTNFTKTYYQILEQWRFTSTFGLGYDFKNLNFSLNLTPQFYTLNLGMGYTYNFGEKAPIVVHEPKDFLMKFSIGYGNLFGLSKDRNSGATVIKADIYTVIKDKIFGLTFNMATLATGLDRSGLPEFFSVKAHLNGSPQQFCDFEMQSIYAGKYYQKDKKEAWFWAGGVDRMVARNKEVQDFGLSARLGWEANRWSGSLVYHVPFTNRYASFLEYSFGVGLNVRKPVLFNP